MALYYGQVVSDKKKKQLGGHPSDILCHLCFQIRPWFHLKMDHGYRIDIFIEEAKQLQEYAFRSDMTRHDPGKSNKILQKDLFQDRGIHISVIRFDCASSEGLSFCSGS